jgi:hypothetical protein
MISQESKATKATRQAWTMKDRFLSGYNKPKREISPEVKEGNSLPIYAQLYH